MELPLPPSLPAPHRAFLTHAVATLAREPWLIGITATGSFFTDTMDEHSDLDFVLAVEPDAHATVLEKRVTIAESLGTLLSAFTGEHVGQPWLLICLYNSPLLHVDFKFDTVTEIVKRAGDLVVLWERDAQLSTALSTVLQVTDSGPDPQWIEDRFWVWVHYAGGKIERGELFQAVEHLTFLRSRVLGPLALVAAGQPPYGVRRIEFAVPDLVEDFKATLANHDAHACLTALQATVELYQQLRASEGTDLQYRHAAERAVTDYLTEIENRLTPTS